MTARHGARAALALGLSASLAGNVIAAKPNLLGRLVAAWPPVALLVAIELVTRIPGRGGPLSALRLSSAGLLAVIAAWVSYWHLVELARTAGEGGIAAHLLPLSVDGLVAVASICLRELGQPLPAPARAVAPGRPRPAPSSPTVEGRTERSTPPSRSALARPAPAGASRSGVGERLRQLAAEHPEWSRAQLAEAAACSERTVRRHLATPVNDRSLDDEWAELAAVKHPDHQLPTDPQPRPIGAAQEHSA